MAGEEDWLLAERVASSAASLLLQIREQCKSDGLSGRDVGDRGDSGSEKLITEMLRLERPDDHILSEEQATDDLGRLDAHRVWIVDPLDGTREFSMYERDDWAVHIALWECSDEVPDGWISLGVVALPAQNRIFNSHNVSRVAKGSRSDIKILASASRPPTWLNELALSMNAEIVPMGSAGAKAMEVVGSKADAYIHSGGQYEWDSAAPVGVALAAGLHASRLDGSQLIYNRTDPYLPDLVICRMELRDPIFAALSRLDTLSDG